MTYCEGFCFCAANYVTKSDIIKLCYDLAKTFNIEYDTDRFLFSPEAITEGGIEFVDYPGKTDKSYKTFRFQWSNRKWPWITMKVMDEWKNSSDLIFRENSEDKIYTFLKAFHGAPKWTTRELDIFESCFEKIGLMIIRKTPKLCDCSGYVYS